MRPVIHLKLGEDIADVVLHRLFANHQLLRNLLVAQPLSSQLKHLQLPLGEPFVEEIGSGLWLALEMLQQPFSDDGAQYDLAPVRRFYGPSQLLRLRLLEHVSPRARSHAGEHRLRFVVHGEQNNADVGVLLENAARGLDPADHGHLDVHQDDVRHEIARHCDGLLAAGRLTRYLHILCLLQDHPDAPPEEGVVVS